MASPQKENGNTQIANELLDAFILAKFNEYQRKVILFIWRKTYGWNKKEDAISNSQFVAGTGIAKWNVSRSLRQLEAMKVVVRRDNKLSINKDWEKWGVVCRDNNSYLYGQQKLSLGIHTKERKTKDISETSVSVSSKKLMRTYTDEDTYEEPSVDLETGEVISPSKVKSSGTDTLKLLRWSEQQRGAPFTKAGAGKQMKYLAEMRVAGIPAKQQAMRWDALSDEPFWKEHGHDWKNVADSFNKKPYDKRKNT